MICVSFKSLIQESEMQTNTRNHKHPKSMSEIVGVTKTAQRNF